MRRLLVRRPRAGGSPTGPLGTRTGTLTVLWAEGMAAPSTGRGYLGGSLKAKRAGRPVAPCDLRAADLDPQQTPPADAFPSTTMPILTLPASFSTAGNDASSSAPSTSPHAVLATLQDELRALLHPARAAPTAAVAGQASPAVAEPAPAEQMTAVELDRAAERAVKEHFALLHAYNEVRDAVEVRLRSLRCDVGGAPESSPGRSVLRVSSLANLACLALELTSALPFGQNMIDKVRQPRAGLQGGVYAPSFRGRPSLEGHL